LARHVLRAQPPPRAVQRLAQALATHPALRRDSPACKLARRRPGLLGPLDAATALLRREDPLRRRLLVAAAVLETEPGLADRFLPEPEPSIHRAVLSVVLSALRGTALLVVGVPILLWAERR
jgi:hypothetical protein